MLTMHTLTEVFTSLFRGVAQIFFIADWRTGVLVTAGVATYDPIAALFMLLGAIAQEVGAWVIGQDREDRRKGIAGFNGALVGIVSWVFAPTVATALLLTVFGGFATVIVFRLVERIFSTPAVASLGLPVSTAPFCLLASAMFLIIPTNGSGSELTSTSDALESLGLGTLNGFAEVVLADGPLAGALILAGLLIGAPVVAGFGLLGAIVATAMADLLFDVQTAATGMMTYSAVLAAMALGAVFPVSSSIAQRVGWAVAGAVVSVGFTAALSDEKLPTFTWPFLLAMWVLLGAAAVVKQIRIKGNRVTHQAQELSVSIAD